MTAICTQLTVKLKVHKGGMPLWSSEELVSAARELYVFEGISNGYSDKDIHDRVARWGGIARYVLEKVSEKEQEELAEAVRNCSTALIVAAFSNIDSDADKSRISHRLVHLTMNDDFSIGRQKIGIKLGEGFLSGKVSFWKKDWQKTSFGRPGIRSDSTSLQGLHLIIKYAGVAGEGIDKCFIREMGSSKVSPTALQALPNSATVGHDLS